MVAMATNLIKLTLFRKKYITLDCVTILKQFEINKYKAMPNISNLHYVAFKLMKITILRFPCLISVYISSISMRQCFCLTIYDWWTILRE